MGGRGRGENGERREGEVRLRMMFVGSEDRGGEFSVSSIWVSCESTLACRGGCASCLLKSQF